MIWKDVTGLEDCYKISNTGLLYSKKLKRLIKLHPNGWGYLSHHAVCKHGTFTLRIHRLVAQEFIPNPKGLPYVNHMDGNKLNNCFDNLEWCTAKENSQHAIKLGLRTQSKRVAQLKDDIIINEFCSIGEASRQTGIDNRRICHNLKGHTKSTDGYTWIYI